MYTFKLDNFPTVDMIGKKVCPSDWLCKNIPLKYYEFMFFYQGEAEISIDEKTYNVSEGDCLFLYPGQMFSSTTNPSNPCKYYVVHFTLNSPIEKISESEVKNRFTEATQKHDLNKNYDVFDMPHLLFNSIFLMDFISLIDYKDLIFNILEKSIQERNQLVLSSKTMLSIYLSEILVVLSRKSIAKLNIDNLLNNYKTTSKSQEAIFYIHNNYMKKITLNGLCTLLNVSQNTLINEFNESFKMTPMQYLSNFRISRAKELLINTGQSIKEISYSIGISDQYYFSKLFKKYENMTPSEYRKFYKK